MSVNDKENDGSEKRPTDAGANRPSSNDPDGAVPGQKEGVGLGADSDANTFEPEEDPEATGESENT